MRMFFELTCNKEIWKRKFIIKLCYSILILKIPNQSSLYDIFEIAHDIFEILLFEYPISYFPAIEIQFEGSKCLEANEMANWHFPPPN